MVSVLRFGVLLDQRHAIQDVEKHHCQATRVSSVLFIVAIDLRTRRTYRIQYLPEGCEHPPHPRFNVLMDLAYVQLIVLISY